MQPWSELEPWWRFGATRTFTLLSLGGAAAAYFADQFGPGIFIAACLSLALMILSSYLGEMIRGKDEGITTEVAGALMPLLGAMMIWGRVEIGAGQGRSSAMPGGPAPFRPSWPGPCPGLPAGLPPADAGRVQSHGTGQLST